MLLATAAPLMAQEDDAVVVAALRWKLRRPTMASKSYPCLKAPGEQQRPRKQQGRRI